VSILPAVVVFDFDPVGTILGFAVRWQIVAVAATILACLLLAAATALVAERRYRAALAADPERPAAVAEALEAALETVRASTDAGDPGEAATTAPDAGPVAQTPQIIDRPWPVSLRMDDLLFIVIAGAAGAVVGGRLGYVLLYLDAYRTDPSAILDPSRGSLTVAGGVALGVLTAMLVATILGAPVRRWLGVAVVPLLLALCLGKLAMVLGGSGQGLPSDASWATAYAGPGPWGSLAPGLPSVPAQLLEAATSAAALGIVLLLALWAPARRHAAVLFAVGLCLWADGRFAVAFGWRDPSIVGELNGDQLVTLAIMVVTALAVVASLVSIRRGRSDAAAPTAADQPDAEPSRPDDPAAPTAADQPDAEPSLPDGAADELSDPV
jgi:phosphatidylglycerol:prolipoprotein diacylglycerol transferase